LVDVGALRLRLLLLWRRGEELWLLIDIDGVVDALALAGGRACAM
jgi:hypothetical protein